MRHVNEHILSA